METLSEAIDRLRSAGYRDSFRPDSRGLRALAAGRLYAPEELVVDEVVRFEGPTDPGDEAILFALRSGDGAVRGTYAAAYGSGTDAANAELVRRLPIPRSGRRGGASGALG